MKSITGHRPTKSSKRRKSAGRSVRTACCHEIPGSRDRIRLLAVAEELY